MTEREQGAGGGPRPVALITGASSGLGAEFARALGPRGYDLLLVARRRKRLEIMAAEAAVKHGVTAEILVADLSDAADLQRVVERARAISDIRILVNAAGFGLHGAFSEVDVEREMDMVRLHVEACVQLTHAVLPAMLKAQRGSVINVASLGAYVPLPGFATYGATKAYMVSFSRSLAIELEGTGVRIQALCPGFTRTEFQNQQGADLSLVPKFMWMAPDQVVASSLQALDKGQVVCVPGVLNRIAARLAGPLGGVVQRRVAAQSGWRTPPGKAAAEPTPAEESKPR